MARSDASPSRTSRAPMPSPWRIGAHRKRTQPEPAEVASVNLDRGEGSVPDEHSIVLGNERYRQRTRPAQRADDRSLGSGPMFCLRERGLRDLVDRIGVALCLGAKDGIWGVLEVVMAVPIDCRVASGPQAVPCARCGRGRMPETPRAFGAEVLRKTSMVQSDRRWPSRVKHETARIRPLSPRSCRMKPPCASTCRTRCSLREMFMGCLGEDTAHASTPGASAPGRMLFAVSIDQDG